MRLKKDKKYTFKDLLDIMAHLRGPDGCMWDRGADFEVYKEKSY